MNSQEAIELLKSRKEQIQTRIIDDSQLDHLRKILVNYDPSKYIESTQSFSKHDWATYFFIRYAFFRLQNSRLSYLKEAHALHPESSFEQILESKEHMREHMLLEGLSRYVCEKIQSLDIKPYLYIRNLNQAEVFLLYANIEKSIFEKYNPTEALYLLEQKDANDFTHNPQLERRLNMPFTNLNSTEHPENLKKAVRVSIDINGPKNIIIKQFESWLDKQQENNNIEIFRAYIITQEEINKWARMNLLAAFDLYLIKTELSFYIEDLKFTESDFLDILGIDYRGRAADEYDKYERVIKKLGEREYVFSLLAE